MRFSSEQVKAIRSYVPGADLMIYLGNDDLPRAHYSTGGRFVSDIAMAPAAFVEIPTALLSIIAAAFGAACAELHEMELACKQCRAPRNPELTEAALGSIAAALKGMNDAKQSR